MTVVITDPNVAVWNTTAGNKTTASAAPVTGDLIIVIAASSGLAGGTTSITEQQGGTYTQVDTDRTGFSTTGVLTVWIRDAIWPDTGVSNTVTANQAGSTGGGLVVLRVQGMTLAGSAAVRSNGGQSSQGAGTTPAPVLSQLPLALNPIITAVANSSNGAAITPPTGYNEREPGGYNTPATGLSVCWLESGENETTITYGATSGSIFASFAIELNTQEVRQPAAIYDTAMYMKAWERAKSGVWLPPKLWTPRRPVIV